MCFENGYHVDLETSSMQKETFKGGIVESKDYNKNVPEFLKGLEMLLTVILIPTRRADVNRRSYHRKLRLLYADYTRGR